MSVLCRTDQRTDQMYFRRLHLPARCALRALTVQMWLVAAVAHGGQGYFFGIPSCCQQMACGCAAPGTVPGEMGGAALGAAGAGDQLSEAPFDLGEAGPA